MTHAIERRIADGGATSHEYNKEVAIYKVIIIITIIVIIIISCAPLYSPNALCITIHICLNTFKLHMQLITTYFHEMHH